MAKSGKITAVLTPFPHVTRLKFYIRDIKCGDLFHKKHMRFVFSVDFSRYLNSKRGKPHCFP